MALFAANEWIVPLADYYPAEYDLNDFDLGRIKVGSYEGKLYFALIQSGGDFLYYRKGLLSAKGIEPPKPLEELRAAVEALHDPANGI